MEYSFIISESVEKELIKLDDSIINQFEKKLLLLQQNPRHKSLRSHQVGKTPNREGIWSSSINMSYRFTWQYGPNKNEITLRHIGTHKVYRAPWVSTKELNEPFIPLDNQHVTHLQQDQDIWSSKKLWKTLDLVKRLSLFRRTSLLDKNLSWSATMDGFWA